MAHSRFPIPDLTALHRRIRALAENRPGIYRMVDAGGRVLYVGKAKRLRARVLSYFQARYPADKAARILHSASDIAWAYVPSEFAAHLAELREIQRHRPPYNVHLNRRRHAVFVTVSSDVAPKLAVTSGIRREDLRYYGPFGSPRLTAAAVRVLNDLLGLRDCADRMPMVFPAQGDLFDSPAASQAACPRYDFGTCTGPCAGLVAEREYYRRVKAAAAFLELRSLQPLDRVVGGMSAAAERQEFEAAKRWRDKFEQLEWLLAAIARARVAIEVATFVYRDPGAFGDERVYLIRHGVVRACYPFPATPIEREAFRAVVAGELARPLPREGLLEAATLDQMLLVLSWFRRHPEALRRTSPLEQWVA